MDARLGCPECQAVSALCLFKKRCDSRQHFAHEVVGQGIYLAGMAGSEVDHTWLIAAHDAGGPDASYRDCKAHTMNRLTAAGDRQDHQQLGGFIELGGRQDQNKLAAVLLMPGCRIERHQVNVTPPHGSSPPTAGASIHWRTLIG